MRQNVLIDPTNEARRPDRETAARLDSIAGRTIGLLDISKARGDIFLDHIADRLAAERVNVLRFMKPTFTKVAPVDLRQQIRQRCDAVIEALAD